MNTNYASASEVIRNLAQIRAPYEVIHTEGRFRVVRFSEPFFDGSEFWVVNDKGFLWEPCSTAQGAMDYLLSDEAREYNQGGHASD